LPLLLEVKLDDVVPSEMEGHIRATIAPSSSRNGATAKHDSELYRAVLTHTGKEGEAGLKKQIVARSQECNLQMVHSGA
jgi:hypothetical protein